MDQLETAHVIFFFLFSMFGLAIKKMFFLYLHITKASSHLTPYRLKDKKRYVTLSLTYHLKSYALNVNVPFTGDGAWERSSLYICITSAQTMTL
jgi:hypothetical protein